jgi:PAS domain S-box-containing protein
MVIEMQKNITSWFFKRPKTSSFLVFLFLLGIVFFFVFLRYRIIKENEHREMSNILGVVRQNIEQLLKNSYTSALTIAMTVNDKGVPENFDAIGKKLVSTNEGIDAVQLVPNGVIKYIYPKEGNESALDLDILKHPVLKLEALKSVKEEMMYFAGPLELKQGGLGIVGRIPVYKNNQFWGFSGVIIRMETLIKLSGIHSIDDSKYFFQFSKMNIDTGKETFFGTKTTDFKDRYFQSVRIPDGDWKLYIISSNKNSIINQTLTSLILGVLFSIFCGLWAYSLLRKPAELQKLVNKQSLKLIENEMKFKLIFDNAPIGIAKVDAYTGRFIEINREFSTITDYTKEELSQMSFMDITLAEDLEQDKEIQKKILDDEIRFYNTEKQYINKRGYLVWTNILATPLWNKGEKPNHIIAIIEDITDKKRAEQDLRDSFELVSEQNKRLLNFSYIVSHNLRSHTSNIQCISTFLETAETQEERHEMIDLLKRVSHSLNETMYNLNEVVNIRSNTELATESINLHDAIENTKEVLREPIYKSGATIYNTVSKDVIVTYNRAYLESVLYNFISNAIRHHFPNRAPEVQLSYDAQKRVLKITDNGVGIDLEKNGSKLFGMYKTFNNTNIPDSKGIGLFITKNQIDAMGGSVEVSSELNIGTTFSIYFK